MPDNISTAGLRDVEEILVQALESERGVRIPFNSKTEALRTQRRAYALREKDRKTIARTTAPGEVLRDSAYDPLELVVVSEDDVWYLKILKITTQRFKVEAL